MFFFPLLIPIGLLTAAGVARTLGPRRVILRAGSSYRYTFAIETERPITSAEAQEIADGLAGALGYRDLLITKGDPVLIYATEDVKKTRAVSVGTAQAFAFDGWKVRIVLRDVR